MYAFTERDRTWFEQGGSCHNARNNQAEFYSDLLKRPSRSEAFFTGGSLKAFPVFTILTKYARILDVDHPIRAFIAIELDDQLRLALGHLQRQLKNEPGAHSVRWVAPQNIHLTLKFLGNVDEKRVPEISGALTRSAHNVPPFLLVARGLGCFPNIRRPNNIWVGLTGALDLASQLTRHIEDECAVVGLPRDERGFTPHLTLGRLRRDVSPGDRAAVGELVKHAPQTDLGEIHVHAVHLIQSDLHPGGPSYTTRATLPLLGVSKQ